MNPDSMTQITEFFKPGTTVNIATIDDGLPRVRPFQFQFESDGKLFFCTAKTKDVYNQLTKNPAIEFVATSPEYVTMRVSGKVTFTDDKNLKEKILSGNELIKTIYQTSDNPVFTLFYLDHGSVKISTMTGEPDKYLTF
ncbi:pyridoxamine 5'-phosphate oxidase family protein [Methanospirillum lacunae]|nr:pyridoxamine 5'-phosphate oxidase family protein [Methanospirillum lacunae]